MYKNLYKITLAVMKIIEINKSMAYVIVLYRWK